MDVRLIVTLVYKIAKHFALLRNAVLQAKLKRRGAAPSKALRSSNITGAIIMVRSTIISGTYNGAQPRYIRLLALHFAA